ncbi:MAG: xylulokinase [Symbiobacteriaceae bacterium]
MAAELFVGIDVGTTGCRALAVDAEGVVRAEATTEYGFAMPRPGWTEQDPEEWWSGAVRCLRSLVAQVGAGAIRGVGLTGQMHGSVFLDGRGAVIRPALLWNDQRTVAQCDAIEARVGSERLYALAGNPALTGFTAPKLLWVREHEPDAYARLAHLLLPKDYVRFRLTGAIATDVTDASGTLLLDVAGRRWSQEILAALDIDERILPALYESADVTGAVSEEAARATGLAAGTPVVAGAGDQAAGAVAAGAVTPGIAAVAVGTSGVVFLPSEEPVHPRADDVAAPPGLEPESLKTVHSFCHAVPGLWHAMGVMLSAGGSLRWLRDALYAAEAAEAARQGADVYDRITADAAEVAPGAEGLLFLPYLAGERTPHFDPFVRGSFLGLSLGHRRQHLARAVLEGIAFGLRDCLDLVRRLAGEPAEVRIMGGGAKSEVWREIIAAVLGVPLRRLGVDEGPALGAAILAAVGVGAFADVRSACQAMVRLGSVTEPPASWPSLYEALLLAYRGAYRQVAPVFREAPIGPPNEGR